MKVRYQCDKCGRGVTLPFPLKRPPTCACRPRLTIMQIAPQEDK
jgi:hypothetical protein